MQIDFSKMKKIGEDIYVYKNFITKEEQLYFSNKALSKKESEWNIANKNINWMKYSNSDKEVELIRNKINSLILDKALYLGISTSLTMMVDGGTWGEHADEHDFLETIERAKSYRDGDPYDLEPDSLWGLVVYFNDFKGGELYYPIQKIEYKPEAGDLLIHSSRNHCRHGVKEVLSGPRITHSNNIYTMIKVPKKNNES